MARKTGMTVLAQMNRFGDVVLTPTAQYWHNRFKRAIREANAKYNAGLDAMPEIYFQSGFGLEDFMDGYLPRRYRRDLEHGWPVRFLIDPWVFATWLGWDINENY